MRVCPRALTATIRKQEERRQLTQGTSPALLTESLLALMYQCTHAQCRSQQNPQIVCTVIAERARCMKMRHRSIPAYRALIHNSACIEPFTQGKK